VKEADGERVLEVEGQRMLINGQRKLRDNR
jgi:hypothetical protein